MSTCATGNSFFDGVRAFFSFIGDPIGTILDLVARAILGAAVSVFASVTAQVPTLSGTTTSREVNAQSQWIVVWLAVGSLLFAAARMAIERRGDAGLTALKGILRVILVSAAATTVVTAAARISDDYSTYLFNAGVSRLMMYVGGCSSTNTFNRFLLLVLAFLLLIAGIIQTILLYIRLGVMIVLLGTLPLAAAASMTDWGAGWWRKHIGWMIAWLLYKPATALVMFAGQAMISSSQKPDVTSTVADPAAVERIAGIGVMLLSAVALPALLKLIVPATAALGGGSAASGGMSMALGAAASGARALGGLAAAANGMGGGSGGDDSGPSGAGGSGGAGGKGNSDGSGSDDKGGSTGGGERGSGGGANSGSPGAAGGAGGSGGSGGDGGGSSGGAGNSGASGAGGGGNSGAGGGGGSGGRGGTSGGGSGAAGVAEGVATALAVTQKIVQVTGSALDDADGNRGHNT
ncbi:hypothetical protein PV415_22265 [Streptomyces sp. ME03-5684b]|uniref:hypothetical protein n=1 Tax=Streptomyces sp. ME03-5684b TaxID=3028681 RepID=UPI0029AB71D6|nr:hypothetical protein [Streptomyces sp. ME03-5684b]MDX3319638.1 hypothetical protein [Streptomyces sp. ME03-5684b]